MSKLRRVAAALVASVVVACGGSATTGATPATSNPNEKVTLSFWDTNAGPTRTPYWQELIKRLQLPRAGVGRARIGGLS